MTFQNINSMLDTPQSPRISPQASPSSQLQNLDFELVTPSADITQDSFHRFNRQQDQSNQNIQKDLNEEGKIFNEIDEILTRGKRTYDKFLGRKNNNISISNTLLQPFRKPRKRVNL